MTELRAFEIAVLTRSSEVAAFSCGENATPKRGSPAFSQSNHCWAMGALPNPCMLVKAVSNASAYFAATSRSWKRSTEFDCTYSPRSEKLAEPVSTLCGLPSTLRMKILLWAKRLNLPETMFFSPAEAFRRLSTSISIAPSAVRSAQVSSISSRWAMAARSASSCRSAGANWRGR